MWNSRPAGAQFWPTRRFWFNNGYWPQHALYFLRLPLQWWSLTSPAVKDLLTRRSFSYKLHPLHPINPFPRSLKSFPQELISASTMFLLMSNTTLGSQSASAFNYPDMQRDTERHEGCPLWHMLWWKTSKIQSLIHPKLSSLSQTGYRRCRIIFLFVL